MTTIPKATLYHYPGSVWCAVVRLAFEEKGYASDEVDLRVVDLAKGENYDPAFLRLNPTATVPTLLVPYNDSLTSGIESRYKSLTSTKTIVEFLDQSRSVNSRTQTISTAPAPALTPATIAATMTCKIIVDILHSEIANPNRLHSINARDDASLVKLSKERLPFITQRQKALTTYLHQAETQTIRVSDKVRALWRDKLDATNVFLAVLLDAEKSEAQLDEQSKVNRLSFFQAARQAWEIDLKVALTQLCGEIIGPFALGDQISIADLHLAGWLSRVVKVSGGTKDDNGETIVVKLEKYIGGGFVMPRDFVCDQIRPEKQTKIGAFWDTIRERPGWKKVYADGLY
jgi:glutathione S-transferase